MIKNASEDFLLSIGRFADIVGASRSQLLYYDRIGVFSPLIRRETGRQAANRFYTTDQIYSYRSLSFFKQLDCPLEEASRMAQNPLAEDGALLRRQIERLQAQQRRIELLRESLELIMELSARTQNARADRPAHFALPRPRRCLYVPLEPSCLRGTERFAEQFAGAIARMTADEEILPAPIGLSYACAPTPQGYFPVRGILMLYREDAAAEAANYLLPAGEYLSFSVRNPLRNFYESCIPVRDYLIRRSLRRRMPIFAWNMQLEVDGDRPCYSECVLFGVVPGETPPGEIPVLPGVE